MSNPILPQPDKLHSTRNGELAAILYTMGFEPVERMMDPVSGDGVPGGRLGYWRFLPICEGGRYSLAAALAHGTDPHQAAALSTPACPIYREQAYMAAAFHNYRMLIEHLQQGTGLELRPCGYLYLLQRRGGIAPGDTRSGAELAQWQRYGSRNTRLAAALATLGFTLGDISTQPGAWHLAHGAMPRVWAVSERSLDGRHQRSVCIAHWEDDAWCARPGNTDPIAAMADAFFNLAQIRAALKQAIEFKRIQHGGRSVMVRRNASDATWQRAESFLLGR